MSRYQQDTNIPPQFAFGWLDDKGKFQLCNKDDPTQVAKSRYIKVFKGVPAKLSLDTERGVKQLKKKLRRQAKLKDLYGCKV